MDPLCVSMRFIRVRARATTEILISVVFGRAPNRTRVTKCMTAHTHTLHTAHCTLLQHCRMRCDHPILPATKVVATSEHSDCRSMCVSSAVVVVISTICPLRSLAKSSTTEVQQTPRVALRWRTLFALQMRKLFAIIYSEHGTRSKFNYSISVSGAGRPVSVIRDLVMDCIHCHEIVHKYYTLMCASGLARLSAYAFMYACTSVLGLRWAPA